MAKVELDVAEMVEETFEKHFGVTLDRLRELAEADKDGRCTGFSEHEAISAWNRRAQPAEPPVRCGECANYQTQNCAAKHEQALMDFCSRGIRKPGGEQE